MNEIKENFGNISKEFPDIKHSKKNMASYGFGKSIVEFFDMAFGTYAFFFYESELGLNVWIVSFGIIIFAIWNAINDPLVGFLTNRPFKFTKKWGRRFPWIFMGGIPWIFCYILIFMPPIVDPVSGAWILFTWLVITTCLFDTFVSIYWVYFAGLYPDKFRSLEERRTAAGIQTPIGTLGIALGAIVPPLLVTFGDIQSYIIQAGATILFGIVFLSLAIPGCRDDKMMVDIYLEKCKEKPKQEPFFRTLKDALKQKNFVVFIITYTLYRTLTVSITASIAYVVRFVLRAESGVQMFISLGFLIGALVSIPLWIKLAHKTNNNRKVILIAAAALTIFTVPLIFLDNLIGFIIAFIFWGIGLGGFWSMLWPVLADVIDESVVKTGDRREGIYAGFQAFFGRLAIVFQAIIFATVHTLTGFVEGADTQSSLAVWGIHIHLALIPMIFMLVGTIIFWRFYDLTPDRVKEIKDKLIEIGL